MIICLFSVSCGLEMGQSLGWAFKMYYHIRNFELEKEGCGNVLTRSSSREFSK